MNYREAYGIHACNDILLSYESKRCGETFVTRKITRSLASIAQDLEQYLYMGSIDAQLDWGHAKDYLRMQCMLLQQDKPEDFVIAIGVRFTVREFIMQRQATGCYLGQVKYLNSKAIFLLFASSALLIIMYFAFL